MFKNSCFISIYCLDGIFDRRVWSVASAFFLPGKNNGSIALIDMKDKTNPGIKLPSISMLLEAHML